MINKKVVIVSEYELTERNGAAFERMKCYSKALSQREFLCSNIDVLGALPNEIKTHKETDNFTLILAPKKKESKAYRILLKHFDVVKAYRFCKYLKNNYKKEETIILLYSSWLPLFFHVIIGLGKIHKYDIVVEKNELETGIIKNINKPEGKDRLLFSFIYPFRLFSAWLIDKLTNWSPKVISISTAIHEKYKNKTHSELVPILVDLTRFEGINTSPSLNQLRFVYLGAITLNKDGLFEIVNSLKNTNTSNNNFTIDIIGSGNKRTINALKNSILENGLENLIKVKDPIKSTNVPQILASYHFSLLVRPSNRQTEYGFSTKLGEYLAAGLPVIFTNVGDNKKYLKDGAHGFLVQLPIMQNISTVFNKAIQITELDLIKMRKSVGELVRNNFDCLHYTNPLNKVFR